MIESYKRVLGLLTEYEKRRFWLILPMVLVLSVIESATVFAIFPFLSLTTNYDIIHENRLASSIYNTGSFQNEREFVIAAGVVLFLLTLVGLASKVLTVWIVTKYALMRSYSISVRLLENFLKQPYEWYISQKKYSFQSKILSEVDKVVSESLLPLLRIIPDLFSVTLLSSVLLVMEPQVTTIVFLTVFLVYGGIYIAAKQRLTQYGKQRIKANKTRYSLLREAFGGIKELKILNIEEKYSERFRTVAYAMSQAQFKGQMIMTLPRQGLEGLALGCIVLVALIGLKNEGANLQDNFPTLGLFAVAGLRLIPSMQQVYHRGSSIRQSRAALEMLCEDMSRLKENDKSKDISRSQKKLSLERTIEVENVYYRYPGTSNYAISDASVQIPANHVVGIVGRSGSGKTTFVDILLGLLTPTKGQIRSDGTSIHPTNIKNWQKMIGYVPQSIFLTDGSIADNIAFGVDRSFQDRERIIRASKAAALDTFIMNHLEAGYDTPIGEEGVRLSGGQKQRVGIARALYRDPGLVVFDEATSALDNITEKEVMKSIAELEGKKTIIIIAHRINTIRNCSQIIYFDDGRISGQGTYDELIRRNDGFKSLVLEIEELDNKTH